ncbi:MAG: LuxR C-terminal-related transcriptional regulator [Actinomycetota bacterium]
MLVAATCCARRLRPEESCRNHEAAERPMTRSSTEIVAARDAARRKAWAEAAELFRSIPAQALGASDVELLADCEWWLCRLTDSMATRQRAYQAYAGSGDHPRAAYNAWFLAYDYLSIGETSIGVGWLERARRQIEDHPECVEHAYLAIADAHEAEGRGDWARASELAQKARDLGERFGDRDVATVALQTLGRELIGAGQVAEGLRLLDEAMTSVIAGELGDFCTGWVYCNVLIACLELGEVARAAEWSDAATRWCESLSASTPYNGLCRVYRVGVLSLRGALTDAEREAHKASEELKAFVPAAASAAWYEIGEIRRRRGDLEGAEEGFTRAHELGADPQPGLALVRLAQGRLDAAQAGLNTSLGTEGSNRLARTRLLAAQVQVALARRDSPRAAQAARELRSMASEYGSSFLEAHADLAEGMIAVALGKGIDALGALQRAWHSWQQLRLPYEAGLTRAFMAHAARSAGDVERAELEEKAALSSFEELGSTVDPFDLVGTVGGPQQLPGGLSPREAQVLRNVAVGKTNRQIATELVISEHTVARHLSNIFAKLGLPSRSAATAYAMENGLVSPGRDGQN